MAEFITDPPEVRRFPTDKQARMDELLDRNNEGIITPDEEEELDGLVSEAERLMLDNLKRLAVHYEPQTGSRRRRAVPVTVWVREEALASG